MVVAPPNTPLSVEVTYDSPGLYVGLSLFDVTGETPEQVGDVIPADYVGLNTYTAKFTGDVEKNYVTIMAVYTDDTYEDLDNSYSNGSESFVVRESSGGGGSGAACELVGLVQSPVTVVGYVEAPVTLIGVVVC